MFVAATRMHECALTAFAAAEHDDDWIHQIWTFANRTQADRLQTSKKCSRRELNPDPCPVKNVVETPVLPKQCLTFGTTTTGRGGV